MDIRRNRCVDCGFEWNGPETECYNCNSENNYPIPENIDVEFISDKKSEQPGLMSGVALDRKLKVRKRKYG